MLTVEVVARLALQQVERWLLKHKSELAAKGHPLVGLIAYGPLIEGTSLEELDLLEVVQGLQKATTVDITDSIDFDSRFLGRVRLVSISPDGLKRAIAERPLTLIQLLRGYRILEGSPALGRTLSTVRNSIFAA